LEKALAAMSREPKETVKDGQGARAHGAKNRE
jgi:hypothetical protein